ncbi:MAG: ACT domain-containing protein, partial [Leptolyngbyaceae cyanobacterium RM1_1_2]|nr:ACT domain-containing protein [Leptolyngbyaceae cyanobacterium RM1_1_2]
EAQLMPEIICDEMLELASLGAKVLHPRAVEIARNYGVPMVVRSSWGDDPGTVVQSPLLQGRSLQGLELAHPVDAIEFDTNQAKVALLRVPDCPGIAARLFGELGQQALNVDLIIQSIHDGNTNDIAFTVTHDNLNRAEAIATAIAPALRSHPMAADEAEVIIDRQMAKVSIIGAGMIGRPGVAAQMFSTLAAAGVNIQMISTSEVKVSCTVAVEDCDLAIAALCQSFRLNCSPAHLSKSVSPLTLPAVRGAALDQHQARLAIRQVPDRPGMAARIFQRLADSSISVDMIIQSQRCRSVAGQNTRDIAFTVSQAEAQAARDLLVQTLSASGCGDVALDTAIAKVSVVGAGMVYQPGVAAKMFRALADENINIQMIATSEIKISCVVAQSEGIRALQAIHSAFELAGSRQAVVSA